jgi:hypothetical protein
MVEKFHTGQMPMRRAVPVIGGPSGLLSLPGRAARRSPHLAANHWRIKKRVPRDPHSKHSDVLEETSKNTNGEPFVSVPLVRT